jgi:hypothetical protein
MLDIFSPCRYLLPDPTPDEIRLITQGEIEKQTRQRWTWCELAMTCEGTARVMQIKSSTEHTLYVLKKSSSLRVR